MANTSVVTIHTNPPIYEVIRHHPAGYNVSVAESSSEERAEIIAERFDRGIKFGRTLNVDDEQVAGMLGAMYPRDPWMAEGIYAGLQETVERRAAEIEPSPAPRRRWVLHVGLWLLAVGVMFALTTLAAYSQEPACLARDVLLQYIEEERGEAVVAQGLTTNGAELVDLVVNPDTGTWAIVISGADGIVCTGDVLPGVAWLPTSKGEGL